MAADSDKLADDLLRASGNGNEDHVLRLLKEGADPNSSFYRRERNGITPLHVAALYYNHPVIVRHLLLWGATQDPLSNDDGWSPLHYACHSNDTKCVEELLAHHCRIDIKDTDGKTAEDVARDRGYTALANRVASYKRDPLSSFPSVKQMSSLQVAKWRELGHQLGVPDAKLEGLKNNQQPTAATLLAAKIKNPEMRWKEIVKGLLTVGEYKLAATVCEQQALDGHSPLSVAYYYKWLDLVKFLEGKEVDTNPQGAAAEVHNPPPQSDLILPRNWTAVTDKKTDEVVYVSKDKTEDTVSTPPGYPLRQTTAHPGVTFYDKPQEKKFTPSCDHFDFDNGVEVSVPPDTIKAGSSVNIKVQPSLASKDIFIMPEGIRSASPSYLLSSTGGDIGGEVTVTIEHHVKVETKEEADNLLFLRADSVPKRSGSKYVYEFKEVPGSKSQFIPGEHKGRLVTSHLSFLKIGVRQLKKWIRGQKPSNATKGDDLQQSEQQAPDCNLYTVRVYRSPPQTTGDKMAIICVSLFGRLYSKFLEELDKEIIPRDYPEVSVQMADRTVIGFLQFTEMLAKLKIQPLQGWTVDSDKEMIQRVEVDQPETENYSPVDLHDYPPKIVCRFHPQKNAPERATFKLSLAGLQPDVTVSMPLRAPVSKAQVTVDTSKLEQAAVNLKKTALQITDSEVGSTVDSILSLIDRMTSALTSSSLSDLAVHTESIKKEIKSVHKVSKKVAEECTRQTIRDNINDSLSKMDVLSHQINQVTKVKLKHCKDQSQETAALEDLVERGANLLTTVDRLLKDMKTLSGFGAQRSSVTAAPTGTSVAAQLAGGLSCEAVVKATSDARSRWYDLGIELGVDLETLKTIGKKHVNNSDDCHAEMVTCWLGLTKPAPSWSALVGALQCNVMSRGDIARRIQEDHHCVKQETEEKDFTLKQVRRVSWDARSEWRNLGSELNIDSDTLAAIEESFKGSGRKAEDCHTAMLARWFQCSRPTSSSLIEALSSQTVGPRGDIASAVKERWGTETVFQRQ